MTMRGRFLLTAVAGHDAAVDFDRGHLVDQVLGKARVDLPGGEEGQGLSGARPRRTCQHVGRSATKHADTQTHTRTHIPPWSGQ